MESRWMSWPVSVSGWEQRMRGEMGLPTFAYRARDKEGRLVTGVVEAAQPGAVVVRLRQRHLVVVEVKPQAVPLPQRLGRVLGGRVAARDLSIFCWQLATMVAAGLHLAQALAVLEQQTENRRLAEAAGGVRRLLEQGSSLHEALGRFPKIFPPLFVNMVRAGETGGALQEILERLAIHFEKENDFMEKVRGATAYPVVVATVSLASVLFILIFVLPAFNSMLASLGAALPLPTRLVMGSSDFLRAYWYEIVGGLLAAGLAGVHYVHTDRGQLWKDRLLLQLPVFGRLAQKMAISRFVRTLGTLIRGGVPILEAMDVVRETAGNRVIADAVGRARSEIQEGESMAAPLAATKIFPPMVIQMIAVGEETGALDTLLEKISIFYDREVEAVVSRLASLIEPALILLLGVVVGFIVLAVMLPIFSLYGAVQ